jgi:hypothetical protein
VGSERITDELDTETIAMEKAAGIYLDEHEDTKKQHKPAAPPAEEPQTSEKTKKVGK